MNEKILKAVDDYYTEKLNKFGVTPQGVDWNSYESQGLRFEMLSEFIDFKNKFSILDYGCGFGAMYEYYKNKVGLDFSYNGFDISNSMINEAKKKYKDITNVNWFNKLDTNLSYDYVVASGIFNVKQEVSDDSWLDYIFKTLSQINQISIKGFSFNLLTKYSDKEYMKDYLYYADPLVIFDYCKKNFSKYVSLKHDYPLYEFTIIVRKDV